MPIPRPSVEGPKSTFSRGFTKSNDAVFAKVIDLINAGPTLELKYDCVDGKIDVTVSYEIIREADFVRRPGFVFLRIETVTFIFHTDRDCPRKAPNARALQQIFAEELLRFVFVLPLPLYTATGPDAPKVQLPASGTDDSPGAVDVPDTDETFEVRAVLVDGGIVQLLGKGFCGLPDYNDKTHVVSCAQSSLCQGKCRLIGGPADGELKDLGTEAEIRKGWVYYCDCR